MDINKIKEEVYGWYSEWLCEVGFRDFNEFLLEKVVSKLQQRDAELVEKIEKEIEESNWNIHMATKSRLKRFIINLIKSNETKM